LTNHISIWDRRIDEWTEVIILSFAAGVESNTSHPLGKAIMEATRAANCLDMKVHEKSVLSKITFGISWLGILQATIKLFQNNCFHKSRQLIIMLFPPDIWQTHLAMFLVSSWFYVT
jgi:cation transport ATPase